MSRSSNRLAWRRTEDNAETRRVRREEAGFLDGVRWGLVDWQDAVARGHRPRPDMPFRAESRDRWRKKRRLAPSEDCSKRHEKTSTTDAVDWIVRGDGPTGGWARSGARASTSAGANTNARRGADACATTAHEECSAGHRKCGRQRGDVYNHLRAADSGFPIERQLR